MRQGTTFIGGHEMEIASPTVRQILDIDTAMAEAIGAKDNDARSILRIKRIAFALQRGGAFLPDPANPNGATKASDLPVEKLIEVLGGDIFLSADEYYDAEAAVLKLIRKEEPKPQAGKGESQAAS